MILMVLLTLLRQLELSATNNNKFEVTVNCKMSGITTTYNGDNKDEVVNTIRQILNAYGMSPEHPSFNKLPRYKVDVGNDAVANQHTVDKNGSITRTDSYVSKINLSEEDQINIARKLLKDCGLIQ